MIEDLHDICRRRMSHIILLVACTMIIPISRVATIVVLAHHWPLLPHIKVLASGLQ
jgi:hypothetical protein